MQPIGEGTDYFLRPRQVAEALGISQTTLWRMRKRGEFPEPVKISRGIIAWRQSTVEEWIASLGKRD